MSILLLVLGLLLFVGLVVLHEFGHFLAARRNNVDVEEFGIGFPPTIWHKKMKSGFKFTVNLLPLGGFVRLKGEHDADKAPGSFGAARLSTKIKIMLAGVGMNLAATLVLFTILALVGMPKLFDNQFSIKSDTKIAREVKNKDVVLAAEVVPDSPAARAGIVANDQIVSLNNSLITNPDDLGRLTKQYAGQSVDLVLKRDGQLRTLAVALNSDRVENQGYLGVASISGEEGIQLLRSTWSAPIVAVGLTKQLSELTYRGLGKTISSLFKGDTKSASEQVSGPVGIFVVLKNGTKLGINFILMVIAILSLTLALINVLPIPALDGGRLFVTLLFRALKKPLSKRHEEWIHGTGFILLMLLFVLITIVDIKRIG